MEEYWTGETVGRRNIGKLSKEDGTSIKVLSQSDETRRVTIIGLAEYRKIMKHPMYGADVFDALTSKRLSALNRGGEQKSGEVFPLRFVQHVIHQPCQFLTAERFADAPVKSLEFHRPVVLGAYVTGR